MAAVVRCREHADRAVGGSAWQRLDCELCCRARQCEAGHGDAAALLLLWHSALLLLHLLHLLLHALLHIVEEGCRLLVGRDAVVVGVHPLE